MLRWEYKTIAVATRGIVTAIDARLAELGNDGWELVAVSPNCGADGLIQLIYTLKRPLAAPSEAA